MFTDLSVQSDRETIRQMIDAWALARDTADWDRLAALWHDDGQMSTTWSRTSAREFVARSRKAFDAGVTVSHTMGGCTVDLRGDRAVAESRMTIIQRAIVHDVLVDVTCIGLFWDAIERREGRWGFVRRQPIYDMDRMSPVDPAVRLSLDQALLGSFPDGYRHLAYLQTKIGFNVRTTLHSSRDPEMAALRAAGRRWLAGDDAGCLNYRPEA